MSVYLEPKPDDIWYVDVDGDGMISSSDALEILRYSIGFEQNRIVVYNALGKTIAEKLLSNTEDPRISRRT